MANQNDEVSRTDKPQSGKPLAGLAAGIGAGTRVPTASASRAVPAATLGRQARDLSTVEIMKEITAEVSKLALTHVELAKTELRADLKAEAVAIVGLGVAALAGLMTINLLFVTAILALGATAIPLWAAGLLVTGLVAIVAAVVGAIAWKKRVRSPMARTRRTVKDDVQFSKETLA